jgi:hypothetical protein
MLKYSEQFKIVAAVGRKQIIQPINKKWFLKREKNFFYSLCLCWIIYWFLLNQQCQIQNNCQMMGYRLWI